MPKIRMPKKIVRNKENHSLEWKKVRLGLEVRADLRDEFKEAIKMNGDTMTDVMSEFMRYYIKETRKHQNNAESLED